jgi:hypothetical protein
MRDEVQQAGSIAAGHARYDSGLRARVCDIYVGADAFLLVGALIWSCMLQPDEYMLVSAAWAAHDAPEQHVWLHRHNQTSISELPRLGNDLGYLQN